MLVALSDIIFPSVAISCLVIWGIEEYNRKKLARNSWTYTQYVCLCLACLNVVLCLLSQSDGDA